jgi:hypothetical protein
MVSTTIAKSFSYLPFHRVNISQAASRSSDATTQRARKGKNQTQVERAEVSRHDGKRCHSNVQRRGEGVGNSAGGALSTNVLGTRRGGTPACVLLLDDFLTLSPASLARTTRWGLAGTARAQPLRNGAHVRPKRSRGGEPPLALADPMGVVCRQQSRCPPFRGADLARARANTNTLIKTSQSKNVHLFRSHCEI